MSEKTEITAQLIEKISEQISQENTAKLQNLIADLHVADIAEILEELSLTDAQFLYQFIVNFIVSRKLKQLSQFKSFFDFLLFNFNNELSLFFEYPFFCNIHFI
mgnify:CR=1 FL=1